MKARRPRIASVFRYSLADHEAMANTYPHVLARLARDGDVHHFCFAGPRRHWLEDVENVHVHTVPLKLKRSSEFDKWLKTLLWYGLAPWLGLWLRIRRFDLVYIEENLPFHTLMLIAFSGCPVAISNADLLWDMYLGGHGWQDRLKHLLMKAEYFAWKRVCGTITHTQASKRFTASKGVRSETIHVVPEACEPDTFFPMDRDQARAQCGIAADEVVIVHHGILHPNKAVDRLLQFLAPVLKSNPKVSLAIAGGGPMRHSLEAMTARLGLQDRVRFLGWLPDVKSLNVLLNAADISIVMREGRFSDHFQVTASLLHSLACGCTILAARLQGIEELIREGVNGLLFDPQDGQEFRDKLAQLIDDPERRARFRAAAADTARERLNPEIITAMWAEALMSFLPGTRGDSTFTA